MTPGDSIERRLAAIEEHLGRGWPRLQEPKIAAIVSAVAAVTGITRDQMLGRRRAAPIVRARQMAMHLAMQHSGQSSLVIARMLGRDHSTVLHGRDVIAARAAREPALAAQLRQLRQILNLPQPEGDA